ncbi:hypothetical protein IWW48_002067 [Coemansia sp. RSA 1200]|nr:hypothetical protein IWW48_002067 [Coemansia sp. RSA 1200]
METVVDLTESPPLGAALGNNNVSPITATSSSSSSTSRAVNSNSNSNAPVLVSSDDENGGSGSGAGFNGSGVVITGTSSGVPSLPEGMVLPPIRRMLSQEQGRPERITTLREVLSTQSSRNRSRNGMSRARPGYRVPSDYAHAPVYSTSDLHTGEEPVEIGVYNPIRARPMLRHERQQQHRFQPRQHQQQQQQRSRSASGSVALAGRETQDGAIDVEDVDETIYNRESRRVRRIGAATIAPRSRYGSGAETDDAEYDITNGGDDEEDEEGDDGYAYEDDDEYFSDGMLEHLDFVDELMADYGGMPDLDGYNAGANGGNSGGMMNLRARGAPQHNSREWRRTANMPPGARQDANAAGGGVYNTRGRRARGAYIFPFPPGLFPHSLLQRNGGGGGGSGGRFNPLDYYASEDIGNLLSFLEATTPAPPPPRPRSPPRPIKLTTAQEKLAATDEYSRQIPPANFRDTKNAPTCDEMEIVCTQCTDSLYEKEPVWAPPCGHIICTPCVDAIAGASKTCTACKKRVMKKNLVHIYA